MLRVGFLIKPVPPTTSRNDVRVLPSSMSSYHPLLIKYSRFIKLSRQVKIILGPDGEKGFVIECSNGGNN